MIITKSDLKILKFIYSRKNVPYKSIRKKFKKRFDLIDSLEALVRHHYLIQVGGYQSNLGEPIPITDEVFFTMDSLGAAEVEGKQWFNVQYILSSLVLPIIVGITSSVITAVILAILG